MLLPLPLPSPFVWQSSNLENCLRRLQTRCKHTRRFGAPRLRDTFANASAPSCFVLGHREPRSIPDAAAGTRSKRKRCENPLHRLLPTAVDHLWRSYPHTNDGTVPTPCGVIPKMRNNTIDVNES